MAPTFGFDCNASYLITPPNFGSGGGSCFPSIVVVALGEPGVPVICWASTGEPASVPTNADDSASAQAVLLIRFMIGSPLMSKHRA